MKLRQLWQKTKPEPLQTKRQQAKIIPLYDKTSKQPPSDSTNGTEDLYDYRQTDVRGNWDSD